jgi:hypothetical protein
MKPLSRGTEPKEYTLRIPCKTSPQFSFSDTGTRKCRIENIDCDLEFTPYRVLIYARGFSSEAAAQQFFFRLQSWFVEVSVRDRVALSFPSELAVAQRAALSFMPVDSRLRPHGWPEQSITPLLVPSQIASVYPEHEFVAIDEIVSFVPTFTQEVDKFQTGLIGVSTSRPNPRPVDQRLLVACQSYAHAAQSTQYVWSFLLTVITLELLANWLSSEPSKEPATEEALTKAVNISLHVADQLLASRPDELDRLKTCICLVREKSSNRLVRILVRKYCAPGEAPNPLNRFADAADCDTVVKAIYSLRSKYSHGAFGGSKAKSNLNPSQLHEAALDCLRHILLQLLQET